MRSANITAGAIAVALLSGAAVFAQQAALPPVPPQTGPALEPESVARGGTLYAAACQACHGADAKGGPSNAADLTASPIAQGNDPRQLLLFLAAGRPDRGMPAFDFTEVQASDLSAKIRSMRMAAVAPTPAASSAAAPAAVAAAPAAPQESIVVGDVALGRKFFNGPVGRCLMCHSVTPGEVSEATNLAHIGSKYAERQLQNVMVLNRAQGWVPSTNKYIVAEVSWADGRTERGYLHSVSDFQVAIRAEDGGGKVFDIVDGQPKVVLKDRMQEHIDLIPKYRNADIHNLTAYLTSLK